MDCRDEIEKEDDLQKEDDLKKEEELQEVNWQLPLGNI